LHPNRFKEDKLRASVELQSYLVSLVQLYTTAFKVANLKLLPMPRNGSYTLSRSSLSFSGS
jgi:hypothetical protein